MKQKRGLEMGFGMIATLVLVLIVLITVALFFSGGFKTMSAKFFGITGGATNVTAPDVGSIDISKTKGWFD